MLKDYVLGRQYDNSGCYVEVRTDSDLILIHTYVINSIQICISVLQCFAKFTWVYLFWKETFLLCHGCNFPRWDMEIPVKPCCKHTAKISFILWGNRECGCSWVSSFCFPCCPTLSPLWWEMPSHHLFFLFFILYCAHYYCDSLMFVCGTQTSSRLTVKRCCSAQCAPSLSSFQTVYIAEFCPSLYLMYCFSLSSSWCP